MGHPIRHVVQNEYSLLPFAAIKTPIVCTQLYWLYPQYLAAAYMTPIPERCYPYMVKSAHIPTAGLPFTAEGACEQLVGLIDLAT